MKIFISLFLFFIVVHSSSTQETYLHRNVTSGFYGADNNASQPFVTTGNVVGQILSGAVFGVVGGIVGIYAGAMIVPGEGTGTPAIPPGAVLGALFGYTLGTSAGVYFAGKRFTDDGSYVITLIGSTIGTIGGLSIFFLTETAAPPIIFSLAIPVTAFHLSRIF